MTGDPVTSAQLALITVSLDWGAQEIGLDCSLCPRWSDEISTMPITIADLVTRARRHLLDAHAPSCTVARCFVRPGVEHHHPGPGITVMGTRWPVHGVGSLGHGAIAECGDDCNNGQCRQGLQHDQCGPECTALVVWDGLGSADRRGLDTARGEPVRRRP